MVKKEKVENLEPLEVLEVDGIIEPNDEFDISVLKSDIEGAKDALNQKIIDQAKIQQETENENIQQETENIQTVDEAIRELLEFGFSFLNRSLGKVDVSKFDDEFMDEFMKRLMKVVPKDKLKDFQKVLGLTDKTNRSIQILKIGKFLMFVIQEIYDRFDEYMVYRKVNEKGKLFKIIKKPEA